MDAAQELGLDARIRLQMAINRAFTPGAPIDNRDLFAGRRTQVDKLLNVIFQKGTHAVLFGERGVGKTSLANTIFDFLTYNGLTSYSRARLNCAENISFAEMWRSLFRQFTYINEERQTLTLDMALPEGQIHSEDIREVFQLLNDPTIIIIDEVDRITDSNVRIALADTIKTVSDNAIDTTFLLVGVADSVDQLIGEHLSIERAIRQVPMPRMSKA